jgi:hypothetical protein
MAQVKEKPVNKIVPASCLFAICAFAAERSWSADVQWVPSLDLRVEQNDNFGLDPVGDPSSTEGYVADAEVEMNVATPRGETAIRPRLRFQNFPDQDDLERVETFFDADSLYRWERSTFQSNLEYSKRDVYNTETLGGEFDPNDPDSPDNPESGPTTVGETRQLFGFRPTFEHRLTERTSLGFSAEYQVADYSADQGAETKVDYDYGLLGTYVRWQTSPRGTISAGAYASTFETDDGTQTADAVGGELGYNYLWSETDGISATVFYERNDITEETLVTDLEETTSDVGGSLSAWRKLEVSEWRFSVSRRFAPTGDRGKSTIDLLRLQYDRDLSERLTFRGAARFESRSGISTLSEASEGDERDYARLDLSLRWFATPTWYIGGGYAYIWQDREADPADADNNKLFVNFGYRGLSRRP